MFTKWTKKIYIASQLDEVDDYGKSKYAAPVEYNFNVMPVTTADKSVDLEDYGQDGVLYQRAIIDRSKYEGLFKEFDKAYLDGATPEGETVNGSKANYIVCVPRVQNKAIALYFKKMIDKR